MKARAKARMLSGNRLHLQDGPIDLVIGAFGTVRNVDHAYRAASLRFANILDELCSELGGLRTPAGPNAPALQGKVARRMVSAVAAFASKTFITPMAAVAGAVSEEVLEAMVEAAPLTKAYVNNGGDIALHMTPGEAFTVGLISRPDRPSLFAKTVLTANDGIFGIATSGWRGRSFSLGIADAVTVLAANAAEADAAATIIANAVDLPGHPGIHRVPACEIQPDSDLGSRLVTRGVEHLPAKSIALALDRGMVVAAALIERCLIKGAALYLQGAIRVGGSASQIPVLAKAS